MGRSTKKGPWVGGAPDEARQRDERVGPEADAEDLVAATRRSSRRWSATRSPSTTAASTCRSSSRSRWSATSWASSRRPGPSAPTRAPARRARETSRWLTRRTPRRSQAKKPAAKKPAAKKPAAKEAARRKKARPTKKPPPKKRAKEAGREEGPAAEEAQPRRSRAEAEAKAKPKPAQRRRKDRRSSRSSRPSSTPAPATCASRRARRAWSPTRCAACPSRTRCRCSASRTRSAAQDIRKLIESAAANAENNHDLVADEMLHQGHQRRRGTDAAPLPAAGARPRDADQQANQPHRRGADPGGLRNRMGQKIHPEGFRVGYIHDWKSNWFDENDFADYLHEDLQIRDHIENKLSHAGLSEHHDRAPRRGRGRHPHRAPGHRDRQVGQRSRRPAQGAPQAHRQAGQGQHPRDQAPRARRQAGRPVDRRAAAEPGRLPPRDEARPDLGDALRRQGRQGPGLGPPRRRRDGAHRGLLRRPRAAAHAARRHRLRLLRGARRRPAGSASSAGSTRARSCPRASAPTRSRRRRAARAGPARSRRVAEVVADADAEAGQAPQADARPDARLHQGRQPRSPSASTGSRRSTAAGSPTARSRPPESR